MKIGKGCCSTKASDKIESNADVIMTVTINSISEL